MIEVWETLKHLALKASLHQRTDFSTEWNKGYIKEVRIENDKMLITATRNDLADTDHFVYRVYFPSADFTVSQTLPFKTPNMVEMLKFANQEALIQYKKEVEEK